MESNNGSKPAVHDEVIARLEKDLERRKEKLNKKPSHYNKLKLNITKDLLNRWKKDKEQSLKQLES